jgi:hypothetical protein
MTKLPPITQRAYEEHSRHLEAWIYRKTPIPPGESFVERMAALELVAEVYRDVAHQGVKHITDQWLRILGAADVDYENLKAGK